MPGRPSSALLLSSFLLLLLLLLGACSAPPPVTLARQDGDTIDVQFGGEPFAQYCSRGHRRPIVWPLCAPGGIPVTRAFPMAAVAGEAQDHPHHESLWFAHGDVNGVDFWQGAGRIEEQQLAIDERDGAVHGLGIWRDGDGREVCRDEHTWRFAGGENWRAVDLDLMLIATRGELRLGDTKEGTFALRLRPELCLRGAGATGAVWTSEGDTGDAAWGKRARWVAYAGKVGDETVVVAIFDHPQNPSHPTWWHARDYGLFAANPFGVHDFTGAPAGTGTQVVPPGRTWRCRYRVFLARGESWRDKIAQAYADWLAGAAQRR